MDIVRDIWQELGLPAAAVDSLLLPGTGLGLPSSFRVGPLAQAAIALSGLAAATYHALRNNDNSVVPTVTVPLRHACAEFKSERLYVLDGRRNEDPWGPVGGLHKAADGYVRIHDGFPHHRNGALQLLGLDDRASRQDVSDAVRRWKSLELEEAATRKGLVIAKLRSYAEWDALPQATAINDVPVQLRRVHDSAPAAAALPSRMLQPGSSKCLQGLRVIELSRVIAAPVAGRTLAAHGADVLWVTSPSLPDLPNLDCDTARGKRTVQLNLRRPEEKQDLIDLIKGADVFLQGYRPGSLAAFGLSSEALHLINPRLIIANLSAFGTAGPWSERRGFDSIVQTCSGMNVSEAEHFADGSAARPMPCQALDHGSGYLLATGIIAALYKQATEGGAYIVDVSLAGTMKYLRSLGQYDGSSGFNCEDMTTNESASEFMETRMTEFGEMSAVAHAARIEGVEVGWDIMPRPLGSDNPEWLAS